MLAVNTTTSAHLMVIGDLDGLTKYLLIDDAQILGNIPGL